MPTDPYGQGVTWPDYTDKPDLKVMGDGIALPLAKRSNNVYQNASTRDATITSPSAGMEAWLLDEGVKTVFDGATWATMAAGAQNWTTPALATGYTTPGNGNGIVQYRIVNMFGDLTVMWRGGFNVTYSGGLPVNGGDFLKNALPAEARPQTALRTVTAACSAVASDSLSVKIDFKSDGTVQMVTQTGVQPPWVSLNNIQYSLGL